MVWVTSNERERLLNGIRFNIQKNDILWVVGDKENEQIL
jgi:hypothetical protein